VEKKRNPKHKIKMMQPLMKKRKREKMIPVKRVIKMMKMKNKKRRRKKWNLRMINIYIQIE